MKFRKKGCKFALTFFWVIWRDHKQCTKWLDFIWIGFRLLHDNFAKCIHRLDSRLVYNFAFNCGESRQLGRVSSRRIYFVDFKTFGGVVSVSEIWFIQSRWNECVFQLRLEAENNIMRWIMFRVVRNPEHAKAGVVAYESNYCSVRNTSRYLRFHLYKKPFNLIRSSRLFFISFS